MIRQHATAPHQDSRETENRANCDDTGIIARHIAYIQQLAHSSGSSTGQGILDVRQSAAQGELERLRAALPDYDIQRLEGHGGQGRVFRGIQCRTGKSVAIKVLHESPRCDERQSQRFNLEIETLARLDHPGIVSLIDCGQADGRMYAVMDYVDGMRIDRYCTLEDLDPQGIVDVFLMVCDAVQYAHDLGVLHRDIKPSNIIVDHGGRPRLLDLGLAKALHRDDSGDATTTGQAVGTLNYWSPEQARALPDIDVRSDVYSLAVVLFRLFAGDLPAQRESLHAGDLLRAVRRTNPLRPTVGPVRLQRSDLINRDLDAIVIRAMSFDRMDRYPSVREFANDLRRYQQGQPVSARGGRLYRAHKFVRRHWAATGFAGLSFLTLAISVPVLYGALRTATGERERATATAQLALELFDGSRQRIGDELAPVVGGQEVGARLLEDLARYLPGLKNAIADDREFELARANLLESQGEIALFRGERNQAAALLEEAAALREPHLDKHDVLANAIAAQLRTLRLLAMANDVPWDIYKDGLNLVADISPKTWTDSSFQQAYLNFELAYAERLRLAHREVEALARYDEVLAYTDGMKASSRSNNQLLRIRANRIILDLQANRSATAYPELTAIVDEVRDAIAQRPADMELRILFLELLNSQVRKAYLKEGYRVSNPIFAEAVTTGNLLGMLDPTSDDIRRSRFATYFEQADQAINGKDVAAARWLLPMLEEFAAPDVKREVQDAQSLTIGLQFHYVCGKLAIEEKQYAVAREHLRLAEKAARDLVSIDAGNLQSREWLAVCLRKLGETFKTEDVSITYDYYRAYAEEMERIAAMRPDTEGQRDVVNALCNFAAAAYRINDEQHNREALAILDRAEHLIEALVEKGALVNVEDWRNERMNSIHRNREKLHLRLMEQNHAAEN